MFDMREWWPCRRDAVDTKAGQSDPRKRKQTNLSKTPTAAASYCSKNPSYLYCKREMSLLREKIFFIIPIKIAFWSINGIDFGVRKTGFTHT